MPLASNIFLFSIDLEDVRNLLPDGKLYRERVPQMTGQYLAFLKKHQARCTFFVVGDQLRAYPDLIKQIIENGHEIACHTDTHLPLNKLNAQLFRADMDSFLKSAHKLGIGNITGFRAPIFSLTEQTAWAYSVLKEFGFTYSSSVLPAKNPLYGWEDFGPGFKLIDGILEMPITLHPLFKTPLAGGVYLRMFPFFMLKSPIKNLTQKAIPLQSYLHPYDIDCDQERFMHPGINNSKVYNYLMYYNRSSVFTKLERIMNLGLTIIPYNEYLTSVNLSNV